MTKALDAESIAIGFDYFHINSLFLQWANLRDTSESIRESTYTQVNG